MENYKSIKYLRSLVNNNKIKGVIDCLQESANNSNDTEFKNIITLINASFSSLKDNRNGGFLNEKDYGIEQSKIISRILSVFENNKTYFDDDDVVHIPRYADFEGLLNELASELASNYYQVSFGNTNTKVGYKIDHEKIFVQSELGKKIHSIEKKRNILIIGAGATASSCPYVPFGKQLKVYLEHKNPKYAEKMKQYGIKSSRKNLPFDPEEYLGELNDKLNADEQIELRNKIHEIYDRRYMPTHTYEFIAHLLKHQFIDMVINFNFDEFLDEAITQELGKSQCIKVIHDSDCESMDKIFIDGRLKTPLYIKIHGTASAKSTLKFTKGHHKLEVSPEINKFIEKWIKGQMTEDADVKPHIPANVICVGFDIERADFYNSLMNKLADKSKLFLINWNKNLHAEDYDLDEFYYYEDRDGKKRPRHIKLENWSKIDDKGKNAFIPPMADFFYRLWNKHIEPLFQPNYMPRSLARHEIVSDIFYNAFEHGSMSDYQQDLESIDSKHKELSDYFLSTRYYFERVIVEIAITLARNKGIIEPREALKDERIGWFYGLYKRKFIEDYSDAKKKFEGIKDPKDYLPKNWPHYSRELFSLNTIYKDCFKLEEKYSFSNNLLNLSRFNPEQDKWEEDIDTHILRDLMFDVNRANPDYLISVENFLNDPKNEHILIIYRVIKYSRLLKSKKTIFSLIYKKVEEKENINEFNAHFFTRLCANMDKIRKGFTYDITPKFLDEGLSYFESVKRKHVLHTNLSLTYHFTNTLYSVGQWDTLLLISERGKFITNHLKNQENGDKTKSPKQKQKQDDIIASLKEKQVIIVACHEAVAEYLNLKDASTLDLGDKYREYHELKDTNVHIHFLPYWRHHHHIAIFLKRVKTTDNKNVSKTTNNENANKATFKIDDETSLEVVKSIYYFKQGFSNKINPLLISNQSEDELTFNAIQHDQELLLNTFIAQYFKAQIYEQDNSFLPVIKPDLSFETTLKGKKGEKDKYYKFSKEDFLIGLKKP